MSVFDGIFEEKEEKAKPISEFKSKVKLRQLERVSQMLAKGEALVKEGKVAYWYSHWGPWIIDPQFLVPGRTAEFADKKVFPVETKHGIFCNMDEERKAAFEAIQEWRTGNKCPQSGSDFVGKMHKDHVLVTCGDTQRVITFEELGGKPKKCTAKQLAVLAEEKRIRDKENARCSRLVAANTPEGYYVSAWSSSGPHVIGYYLPRPPKNLKAPITLRL